MRDPSEYVEFFLQPGEFYMSDDPDTRIRTLLGSCVAMTMWHPRRRIGAMCHYLLPTRGKRRQGKLDGRFGDEAYLLFLNAAIRHHVDPGQFEIKLFGGGDMFPDVLPADRTTIGAQNVAAGVALLAMHGQPIKAQHVCGKGHRIIMLDVWDGSVWVKHQPQFVSPPVNFSAGAHA